MKRASAAEVYSEPCQTSKMERFPRKLHLVLLRRIHCFPMIIFWTYGAKVSIAMFLKNEEQTTDGEILVLLTNYFKFE